MARTPAFDETQHPREASSGRFAAKPQAAADPDAQAALAAQAAAYRSEAARHHAAAADSFERSDTDGFVSQWASGLSGRKAELAAQIAEAGGVWEFPALYNANGTRVPAKLIDGNFGPCWALVDPDTGSFTGEFIGAFKKGPRSKLARRGFVEGTETAPAAAALRGPAGATGLSGAASVTAVVVRTDDGTGLDEAVAHHPLPDAEPG